MRAALQTFVLHQNIDIFWEIFLEVVEMVNIKTNFCTNNVLYESKRGSVLNIIAAEE